ncbi:hypothetical protein BP5796_02453 [Coleophoma crateriformis]|uniref:Uncharacterized protein n=1 Tax=Coleophoma crateriformis TaxID=565419 RepID=A0A3D8SZV6_9HELO|nr:hypothetical protein BP5796_02453 [Coleophoma crateriformis]
MCYSYSEPPNRYFNFDLELRSSRSDIPDDLVGVGDWQEEGEDDDDDDDDNEAESVYPTVTADDIDRLYLAQAAALAALIQTTTEPSSNEQSDDTTTVLDASHDVDWRFIDAHLPPRRTAVTQEEMNMMNQVNELGRMSTGLPYPTSSDAGSEKDEEEVPLATNEAHELQDSRALWTEGDVDFLLEQFDHERQASRESQLHYRFLYTNRNIVHPDLNMAAWNRELALVRSAPTLEPTEGLLANVVSDSIGAQAEDSSQEGTEGQVAIDYGSEAALLSPQSLNTIETLEFYIEDAFCL